MTALKRVLTRGKKILIHFGEGRGKFDIHCFGSSLSFCKKVKSVSQSQSHRTTRAAHKWQWRGGFRPSWQRRPVTSTIITTPKSHGAALWHQTMSFSILPLQSPPPLVSHLLTSTAHSFIYKIVTDPFLDLGFYFLQGVVLGL